MNSPGQTVTANVTFETNRWAFPGAKWLRLTNLFDGGSLTIDLAAGSNSVPLTLQPNQCTVYAVQAGPSRPVLLLDGGSSGMNPFGFDVDAAPGQSIVVEAAPDLLAWVPLQTNVVPETGWVRFADPDSTALARRFYRARLP